jgi:hypothetical protein
MSQGQSWGPETLMPWGEHKGKPLKDLPMIYLLWLSEQSWIKDWNGLHAYLQTRQPSLKQATEERNEAADLDEGFKSYDDYRKNRGF